MFKAGCLIRLRGSGFIARPYPKLRNDGQRKAWVRQHDMLAASAVKYDTG
jgi:hypothetical protein